MASLYLGREDLLVDLRLLVSGACVERRLGEGGGEKKEACRGEINEEFFY
jgi:hypothetical protein